MKASETLAYLIATAAVTGSVTWTIASGGLHPAPRAVAPPAPPAVAVARADAERAAPVLPPVPPATDPVLVAPPAPAGSPSPLGEDTDPVPAPPEALGPAPEPAPAPVQVVTQAAPAVTIEPPAPVEVQAPSVLPPPPASAVIPPPPPTWPEEELNQVVAEQYFGFPPDESALLPYYCRSYAIPQAQLYALSIMACHLRLPVGVLIQDLENSYQGSIDALANAYGCRADWFAVPFPRRQDIPPLLRRPGYVYRHPGCDRIPFTNQEYGAMALLRIAVDFQGRSADEVIADAHDDRGLGATLAAHADRCGATGHDLIGRPLAPVVHPWRLPPEARQAWRSRQQEAWNQAAPAFARREQMIAQARTEEAGAGTRPAASLRPDARARERTPDGAAAWGGSAPDAHHQAPNAWARPGAAGDAHAWGHGDALPLPAEVIRAAPAPAPASRPSLDGRPDAQLPSIEPRPRPALPMDRPDGLRQPSPQGVDVRIAPPAERPRDILVRPSGLPASAPLPAAQPPRWVQAPQAQMPAPAPMHPVEERPTEQRPVEHLPAPMMAPAPAAPLGAGAGAGMHGDAGRPVGGGFGGGFGGGAAGPGGIGNGAIGPGRP